MKTVKMLRMEKKRATKLNNKGMSLVEVIVAITILGIVVVPVLQSLTTAMVYNAKARTRQKLTLTAESIMETFKGYSLESLQAMFDNKKYTATDNGGISGVENADTEAGTTYTVEVISSDVKADDGSITVPKGSYVFKINDFVEGDETYNAEITVTPSVSQTIYENANISDMNVAVFTADTKYDRQLIKGESKLYNEYLSNPNGAAGLYAEFSSIASNKAGISNDDANWIYKGLKIYTNDNSAGTEITEDSLKVEDVKNYIQVHDRTTTFEVNGTSVDVTMEYHFYISGFPYYVEKQKKNKTSDSGSTDPDVIYIGESNVVEEPRTIDRYPSDGNYITYKVTIENYQFYKSSNNLERLYIYYFPQYDTGVTDIININDNAGVGFDCYLIKQMASDLTTNAIELGEESYKPEINLKNELGATVNLYHNLGENVADSTKSIGTYKIGGSFKDVGSIIESNTFKKDENLAYNVEVVIKKPDDSIVTLLKSSMNEKVGKKDIASGTEGASGTDTESVSEAASETK